VMPMTRAAPQTATSAKYDATIRPIDVAVMVRDLG